IFLIFIIWNRNGCALCFASNTFVGSFLPNRCYIDRIILSWRCTADFNTITLYCLCLPIHIYFKRSRRSVIAPCYINDGTCFIIFGTQTTDWWNIPSIILFIFLFVSVFFLLFFIFILIRNTDTCRSWFTFHIIVIAYGNNLNFIISTRLHFGNFYTG